MMLGPVIDVDPRGPAPTLWRRYLVLALDGLAANKGESGELPVPALTPEELDEALRCGKL